MGLGCNAVGVTGCRIIDSPRERLSAVLTNSFMPCNGRFPALIAVITMFFADEGGFYGPLLLSVMIVGAVCITLVVTKILSCSVLKGESSAFTLELPNYRKPDIVGVLARSFVNRTLFVLSRAVTIAAPAGLVIWVMANLSVGESTLLLTVANALDGVGGALGVDGVFLLALFLGIPANEIVLAVAFMCYSSGSALVAYDSISELRNLFVINGWNRTTAVCALILLLFHFPCATTLFTIKKETGSAYYATISFILPMIIGCLLAMTVNFISWIV